MKRILFATAQYQKGYLKHHYSSYRFNFSDLQEEKLQDPPVYRIVLTGGPCAGKSSALTLLSERIGNLGFNVYSASEVASLMLTGGVKFSATMTKSQLYTFESQLIKTQMALENSFVEIAKVSEKPSVVICDRGCMDAFAYMSLEDGTAVMDMNDWNAHLLRDNRYDSVIHMVTAALGAEKYYTKANNSARMESVEQAQEVDFKLRQVWNGHPNYHIVDNHVNFQHKVNKVLSIVTKSIGLPSPMLKRRKFLLKSGIKFVPEDLPYKFVNLDIEQVFLKEQDKSIRLALRKRGENGQFSYSLSAKKSINDHTEVNSFRSISSRSYGVLGTHFDPAFRKVHKKLYTFLYRDCYYELVFFVEPHAGTAILSLETEEKGDLDLPPHFLNWIEKEVTHEHKYSTQELARVSKRPIF